MLEIWLPCSQSNKWGSFCRCSGHQARLVCRDQSQSHHTNAASGFAKAWQATAARIALHHDCTRSSAHTFHKPQNHEQTESPVVPCS